MSTQTPGLPPVGCSPCAPFPTSTPLSQGGAAHGNAHPRAPCALSLGCPFPSFPASGHLFIYLFIYLSYLLVFIDNWKSGWGGLISAAQWGQLGLPHSQPLPFGVLLGAPLGAPTPFWRGRGGKGSTPCLQGGRPVLPLPCRSLERSLPCPSLFTDPASWCLSRWICCFQPLERAGGARMDECHYGEQTKPGILLPRGENQRERKAGFAECLKHK